MKNTQLLAIILLSAFSSSCTSALKRRCEATNWYEYGESVAKRGQRVSFDSFIQQCEREDARIDTVGLSQGFKKGFDEYCTADFAYRLAKDGQLLSEEMCSGSSVEKQMKVRHAEGVREYCRASNGVSAGARGVKYNQICPKDLEEAFLPQFNMGRKRYLSALMTEKEKSIQDLDKEIADLNQRRSEINNEIHRLDRNRIQAHSPRGTIIITPNQPVTQADPKIQQVNQSIDREIQNHRWELQKLDRELDSRRTRQRQLRDQIHEANAELITL